MKKLCLFLIGILFLSVLQIFAQTGRITLQVDWIPAMVKTSPIERLTGAKYEGVILSQSGDEYKADIMAKSLPMGVYVDGSEVFTIKWKESKEITLSSGSHTISVRMKGGNFEQTNPISFSANSGRIVFRATPYSKTNSINSIELVQVSPSSQPQSIAQQPQTNNNQSRNNSNNQRSNNILSNTNWNHNYVNVVSQTPVQLFFGNDTCRFLFYNTVINGTYTVSGDTVTIYAHNDDWQGNIDMRFTGTIVGNSINLIPDNRVAIWIEIISGMYY